MRAALEFRRQRSAALNKKVWSVAIELRVNRKISYGLFSQAP